MTIRLGYTCFMLLAAATFVLARRLVPRPPALAALPWPRRALLAMSAFAGGSLGAKVPFVLGAPEGPFSLVAWISDGKTITAGLLGAYLAVELTKYVFEIHVKTGDTFALPLALALAVGRWGCFVNGCCYGQPTPLPWGIDFGDGAARHPTQAYESLFHLTMALVLYLLLRYRLLPGQHLKLYLIAYGAFRFLTEWLRPEPSWWLDLTMYQWLSVVMIVGLAGQWVIDARQFALQNGSDH